MRILRTTFLLLLVTSIMSMAGNRCLAAPQDMMPRVISEIRPSMLEENGKTAQVRAFDIAPDGRAVALLYASWGGSPHPVGAELWVAVWNISSNKIAWKQKIATDTLSGAARLHDVKDLIFTADQGRLLALGLTTVWSIDPKDGAVLSSIGPPDRASGAPVQIQALSEATVAITYVQHKTDSFYTELVDVSAGKKITGFETSAIPQSFSPDGKLAVATTPARYNAGGVTDLQVTEVATGAVRKVISTTFGFKRRHSDEHGSVVVRFLDNHQLLVVPDNMIDHTGNHSGYSLEVIDVSTGALVRAINPPFFGPTGELVLSGDRSRFAVHSVYASPKDFQRESLHPKDLHVNLFIYSKDAAIPETVIPNMYLGLPGGSGAPLRLSFDGSVLAVSVSPSGVIKIFRL